jgi:anti-sigma B factor antagonist
MSPSPGQWLIVENGADGQTVVRIPPNKILDEVHSEAFGEQLFALAERADCHKMILDFTGVGYMSSGILAKLITLNKMLRESGGSLTICNMDPRIYEIFVITKLNKLFRLQQPDAPSSR